MLVTPYHQQCLHNASPAVQSTQYIKPNTHRRRDETVELRRVSGVYMNSQLAHDDCRRFGDVNAAAGRDPVYNAVNAIEVGWRNIWRCMFVNIRINRVV